MNNAMRKPAGSAGPPAPPSEAVADAPARANPDQCVSAMGFRVYNDELSRIPLVRPCSTVQTISPISYGMAQDDSRFREALENADWLCLDGVYFGLAGLILEGRRTKPNQGPDIFDHFMDRLQSAKGRAFFLGASERTLDKIKDRAARHYPDVAVGTYSPPFKPEFDAADNDRMIDAVNAFRPDVLFLGMTAPKQEKWAHAHRDRLDACVVASIGGVFDWYAGNRKEIAPIWWKLRLAWLIRTIDRPELLKRYPMIARFTWHLCLARIGIKKFFKA